MVWALDRESEIINAEVKLVSLCVLARDKSFEMTLFQLFIAKQPVFSGNLDFNKKKIDFLYCISYLIYSVATKK